MRKKVSCLPVWSSHLTICFRGLFAGMLLLFVYAAAGDEEEGQDGLDITSTTTLQSALFNLGLSQDSAEDDLKRKSIGVGETITINLEVKDALIGNVEELEWKVEDEKGVLILPDKMKGKKSIKLRANPAAKEAGKVKITVQTGTGLKSKPYHLNVAVPLGAVAQKTKEGQDTPLAVQNQMPGVAFASAWMIVKVTIHPLEVNFSNMKILEVDAGYVNPEHNTENRPPHHPKPTPAEVSSKNQFDDEVALDFPMTRDQLLVLEQENPFTWGHQCRFKFTVPNVRTRNVELGASVVGTNMNCDVSKNNQGVTIKIDKFTSAERPVEVIKTTPAPQF